MSLIGLGERLARASSGDLASLGEENLRLFASCITSHIAADKSIQQQISCTELDRAEQRFRLWAMNLGLFAKGHGSLDYRLRDSELVLNYTREVLIELVEYLDAICKVLRNERPPFEKQVKLQGEVLIEEDIEPSSDVDNLYAAKDWIEPVWNSDADDDSSSENGFEELPFRLQGIDERLDSLFTLAFKIRKPVNRPTRTISDLFKHSKSSSTNAFIQEREQIEGQVIGYMLEQHITRFLQLDVTLSAGERQTISHTEFRKASQWLIDRIGRANTRRKQQFVYWREHSLRLGSNVPSKVPEYRALETEISTPYMPEPPSIAALTPSENEPGHSNVFSNPTTATHLNKDVISLDDSISMTSSVSRVSTKKGWHGELFDWPDPPKVNEGAKFFVCPYCKTVCPQKYLAINAWRAHLFQDLQPYQCTFPECNEADRLYGSRTEWIEHEATTHQRVWVCQVHSDVEYETRDLLLHHLAEEHENEKDMRLPRIIDACAQTSKLVRRTCPFCPALFVNVTDMHDHIIFHLERFAALALPKPYEIDPYAFSDDEDDHDDEHSQSAKANVQGRPDDSRIGDFNWETPIDFEDPTLPTPEASPSQTISPPREPYKDAPVQLKKLETMVKGDLTTRVTSLFGVHRPPPTPDDILQQFRTLEHHIKLDLIAAINDMICVGVNVYREPSDRIEVPNLISEIPPTSIRSAEFRQHLASLNNEHLLANQTDGGETVNGWRNGVLRHGTYTAEDAEGNIITGWPGMRGSRGRATVIYSNSSPWITFVKNP